MLENSNTSDSRHLRFVKALGVTLWVIVAFIVAQLLVLAAFVVLRGVGIDVSSLSETVLDASSAALVYVLSVGLVLGAAWLVLKSGVTLSQLGLQRLPSWLDLLVGPAAFIPYMLLAVLLTLAVSSIVPGFDLEQTQEVGFENLTQRYQYILAFLTLVVVAPVAEEVLFRGYLYAKIKRYIGVIGAILLTSLCFAVLHMQLNVAVNVFALSLVLCGLREVTGSIWAGILLHMIKNGVAYFALFVAPTLL